MNQKGQSMLELVIGIGLVTIIAGAIAVVTTNSLQNTQFSKNQVQATKMAQENIEKVRAIKNSNFGICTKEEVEALQDCSTWDDVWVTGFGTEAGGCVANDTGCTFSLQNAGCTVNTGDVKPFCLRYIDGATRADLGDGFSGQIIIEDEAPSQKKVTSRVFWTDSTGEHASDLVTVMTRI